MVKENKKELMKEIPDGLNIANHELIHAINAETTDIHKATFIRIASELSPLTEQIRVLTTKVATYTRSIAADIEAEKIAKSEIEHFALLYKQFVYLQTELKESSDLLKRLYEHAKNS